MNYRSGMLANGVQRVIEQVINPKILQVIKPQVDDVICKELGIDAEKRKADQEEKKNQQKQNLQNMINMSTVTSPGKNLKYTSILNLNLHAL